jgi:hypothetical protein
MNSLIESSSNAGLFGTSDELGVGSIAKATRPSSSVVNLMTGTLSFGSTPYVTTSLA